MTMVLAGLPQQTQDVYKRQVQALWKAKIYAESGMGCTGPLVMMSEANHDKAVEILKAAGYISRCV